MPRRDKAGGFFAAWAGLLLPFLFVPAADAAVIASYGFNGNAADSSGNGYTLTAKGSPAYSAGNCDGASSQEYGPVSDASYYSEGSGFLAAFSNLSDYSISFYFNAASLTNQPVLLSWTTAGGTWNFLQILAGGTFSLDLNGVNAQAGTPVIATGSCHSVTLSQAGTTASLWVDGTLAATLDDGGGTGVLTALYAGAWANGTGYAFDGTLEDLTFSNMAYAPTPTVTPTPGGGPIRVACVGASITWGYCSTDQATDSYPSVLQTLLGSGYEVQNDGDSGAGILKLGQEPYWYSSQYYAALTFNPNIVIIDLGANDTKPVDWQYNADIAADYVALVNLFRALPSHPTVYMSLPCWVYTPNYGITEDIVAGYLLPEMIQIANQQGLCMIDMFDALYNQTQYYCTDGVHLNDAGYAYMAQVMYNAITQRTTCYEPVTPIPTATATPALGAPAMTWRVNAGGPAYTDASDNLWFADCNFTGGASDATAAAIGATANETLYQSERQGDVVTYAFPVPAWDYQVTLKFAEIDGNTTGQRQQNVYINGNQILSNFDIYAQAGADHADDQVYDFVAPNALNQIFIQLGVPTSGQSSVCAIQIVPEAQSPTPTYTVTPTATPTPTEVTLASCATPPVIDGVLNDPVWSGPTYPVDNLVVGATNGGCSGAFETRYDQTYFYLAVAVTDPTLYYGASNCDWCNSAVEVFLNMDYPATSSPPAAGNFNYVVDWSGNSRTCACLFPGYGSDSGVLWGTTTTASGWDLEMAIPWSTLGKTPAAGMQLGFNLQIDSNHSSPGSGGRTAQIAWTGNGNAGGDSSQDGVILMGPGCWMSSTLSPSSTDTPSASPSSTPTLSPSSTDSPSVSPTPSATASLSATPISSATRSLSPSPSPSPPFSASETDSPSPSDTASITPAPTASWTPSATPSLSPSRTPSMSATVTAGPTGSPTPSASVSATPSPNPTPTASATASASPAASPSGSPTSGSAPGSRTRSATPSLTATPATPSTPASTQGGDAIDQGYGAPNPNPQRAVFHLLCAVDDVEARIYSKALVCLWQGDSGPRAAGWGQMPLAPQALQAAGQGLSYLVLTPILDGSKGRRAVVRIVMLH